MKEIFVFGDSVVYGIWDEQGGWVSRLRRFLDKSSKRKRPEYLIYALGRSGGRTDELLKRFEFEFTHITWKNRETTIVFQVGINDVAFTNSKNDFRIPFQEFSKNIQKLIDVARKFTPKIIFIGLMPVDESKTNPIPWDKDLFYKNKYILDFDKAIKKVCKKNNVYLVEVFNEFFENENYKNLLEDGLHPNSKGHEKIFKIVKDFLIKEKII